MITIKCFGNVEISGNGIIPSDIEIISSREILQMNLEAEFTNATAWASIKEGGKE